MKNLLFLILIFSIKLHAQFESPFTYGIKAQVNYSDIKELSKMIVSEDFYTGYELTEEKTFGYNVGAFINYKFRESKFAFQPEITYAKEGGLLHYKDVNNLEYNMNFDYRFLQLNTLFKIYPVGGLSVGVGPQFGINLTPNNIKYTSNAHEIFGLENSPNDTETEKYLQEKIKGKSNFQAIGVLGYEFEFGLMFDFRYVYGLTDIIETSPNQFRWVETNNTTSSFLFTVGYVIDYQGNNPF